MLTWTEYQREEHKYAVNQENKTIIGHGNSSST